MIATATEVYVDLGVGKCLDCSGLGQIPTFKGYIQCPRCQGTGLMRLKSSGKIKQLIKN